MKNRLMGYWGTGILLGTVLATGCAQKAISSPEQTNTLSTNTLASAAEEDKASVTDTNALAAEQAVAKPEIDIAEANFKPLSTPKTVPVSVRTNGPVGEIIRMAESGVDEAVLLSFVTNSTSTFSLSADEIIYLNDIGVPPAVVTAMIQQDQGLRAVAAGMTNVWSEPAATETAQAPAEVAPQSTAPTTSGEAPPPPAEGAQPVPQEAQSGVTYNTFYSTLSPYGNWVYIEGYGNVWQPAVVVSNPDWSPYVQGGRWLYTDAGWYWYSDYSWGWAPFHYGRWFRHYRLGWCWYPDYVWGPSWVTWRYTDGYCGWAPLPPGAWWRPGIGLTFWGSHVGVGFTFGLGYAHFNFVPWNHFHHHHGLQHYRIHDQDRIRSVYRESVVATRIHGSRERVINDGLPAARVAKATGSPLRPVSIQARSNLNGRNLRPERFDKDNNTVSVFRPAISRQNREPGAGGVAMNPTATATRTTTTRSGTTTVTTQRSIAASRFAANRTADASGTTKEWERPVPATGRTSTSIVQTPRSEGSTRSTSPTAIARQNRELLAESTDTTTTRPATTTSRSPFAASPLQSRQGTTAQRTVNPSSQSRVTQSTSPETTGSATQPSTRTTARTPTTGTWQRGQPQLQARTDRSAVPADQTPSVRTPSPVQRSTPSAQAPSTTAPQSIWQRPNNSSQSGVQRSQNESVNRWPGTRSTTPAPSYTPPQRTYSAPSYQAPSYQAPVYQAPRTETPRVETPRPSYQAPVRSEPSYSAPTRSAPSYSPPSTPSYSAPARSAPSAPAAPSYSPPPASSRSSSSSSSDGGGRDVSGFNRQSRQR